MKKSINNIVAVKLSEQRFDVDKMRPGTTWVIEINKECICTYHTEYKSRTKIDVVKAPVDSKKVKAFFKELYDFVRSADECDITTDDCSHKVTFFYESYHREHFTEAVFKDGEILHGKIHEFVKEQTGNTYA